LENGLNSTFGPFFIFLNFQTLELYSLQGDYLSYYVRDYYVQVDGSKEEEVKILAFCAPVLENGHKAEK